MKVKLKERYDHLSAGEVYDVVRAYSPFGKHSSDYLASASKTSYLLIMPDTATNGHVADASIKSWWVPMSCLEVIEGDNSVSKLKIGQRWRWKYQPDDVIVEIINIVPSEYYANCKILQVISGSRSVNDRVKWNFDSSYWEYLVGQDSPIATALNP
jgi:hypothetical protein